VYTSNPSSHSLSVGVETGGEIDPSSYYVAYGGRFGRGRSSWRGGRIGRAGRSYGRNASAVGNKTWVRPTDLENSLANTR